MVLHSKALHLEVLLLRRLLLRAGDVPRPHLELVHLNSLRNHLTVDELLLLHVHAVLACLKVDLLLLQLLRMLQLHLLMVLRLLLHLLELRMIGLHLRLVLHLHARLAQLMLAQLLWMLLPKLWRRCDDGRQVVHRLPVGHRSRRHSRRPRCDRPVSCRILRQRRGHRLSRAALGRHNRGRQAPRRRASLCVGGANLGSRVRGRASRQGTEASSQQ